MQEILGEKKVRLSTPIISMKKDDDTNQYELFTTDGVSVGIYDDVIFACHTDTTTSILKTEGKSIDESLIDTISKIEYADNVVYLHSDPKLMPLRRRAWASWNCLGNSDSIKDAIGIGNKIGSDSDDSKNSSKNTGAFEGAESGFGNTATKSQLDTDDADALLEGKDGRMKAVYVTYWLNRLQNLDTGDDETDIFVSFEPAI